MLVSVLKCAAELCLTLLIIDGHPISLTACFPSLTILRLFAFFCCLPRGIEGSDKSTEYFCESSSKVSRAPGKIDKSSRHSRSFLREYPKWLVFCRENPKFSREVRGYRTIWGISARSLDSLAFPVPGMARALGR